MMKKTTKKWMLAAGVLTALGAMIFLFTACAAGFDFSKLSTEKYENNTYEITDSFKSILINSDTEDITVSPSNDGKCKVELYESENMKHDVSVKDGTLEINLNETKKWYDYISIGFQSEKINLYLPLSEYEALKIKESTGDITIHNSLKFSDMDISLSTGDVYCSASCSGNIKISTDTGDIELSDAGFASVDISGSTGDVSLRDINSSGNIDIKVSTGDVNLSDTVSKGDITVRVSTGKTELTSIVCKNLISSGNTGEIKMNDVIASENFNIKRTTGDVEFYRSDAKEIFITTDTGEVEGSLLSEKVFITKTDTGDVRVPSSITGGRCEITTDTGDIEISIAKD